MRRRDRERHAKWERRQLPRCRHNEPGEECRQCAKDAREDARAQTRPAVGVVHAAGPVHTQDDVRRWDAMKYSKFGHI